MPSRYAQQRSSLRSRERRGLAVSPQPARGPIRICSDSSIACGFGSRRACGSRVEPSGGAPADRLVVDLREAEEITDAEPSLPGAVNIPLTQLRARVDEIPRDRPLLCICAMGTRSAEAAAWLASRDFADIVYLAGGMNLQHAR